MSHRLVSSPMQVLQPVMALHVINNVLELRHAGAGYREQVPLRLRHIGIRVLVGSCGGGRAGRNTALQLDGAVRHHADNIGVDKLLQARQEDGRMESEA